MYLANVWSKMCLIMTVITDKPHGKQHLYRDSGEHNSAALWFQVQQSIWYIDCSAFLMRLHFYCFSHRKIIPLQKGKWKILTPKMKDSRCPSEFAEGDMAKWEESDRIDCPADNINLPYNKTWIEPDFSTLYRSQNTSASRDYDCS